jgi:hypothetical protein
MAADDVRRRTLNALVRERKLPHAATTALPPPAPGLAPGAYRRRFRIPDFARP